MGFNQPPHNPNEPAGLPLESHVELSQESTTSKLNGQQKAGFPPIQPGHTRPCSPGSMAAPGPAPGVQKGEISIKTELPQFGECFGKSANGK